jgi:hypothetical protein
VQPGERAGGRHRALERSLQEAELRKRAAEIQRDTAQQRGQELELRLAEVEERAAAAAARDAEVASLRSRVDLVTREGAELRGSLAAAEAALAEAPRPARVPDRARGRYAA